MENELDKQQKKNMINVRFGTPVHIERTDTFEFECSRIYLSSIFVYVSIIDDEYCCFFNINCKSINQSIE